MDYTGLVFLCTVYATTGAGSYIVNKTKLAVYPIFLGGANIAYITGDERFLYVNAASGYQLTSVWWTLLG